MTRSSKKHNLIPEKMKAVTFNPTKNLFEYKEGVSVPVPSEGEVLVRVEACGLNPRDAYITSWKREVPTMTADFVTGHDVAGIP